MEVVNLLEQSQKAYLFLFDILNFEIIFIIFNKTQKVYLFLQINQSIKQTDTVMIKENLRCKSNSVCLPTKKLSKKHCFDDLACLHCCKCWITHKKQCQIRNATYNNNLTVLQAQNKLLKQSIQKLVKEILHFKKQRKQKEDVESLKEKLKAELLNSLDQEAKMNILIQNQKIESLNQRLKHQELQNEKINKIIKQQQIEIGEYLFKNKQLQSKIAQLQQNNDYNQLKQIHESLLKKIITLQNKQKIDQLDIKRKNQVINKLQLQLKESEKVINTKTSIQSQYEYQEKKLTISIKEKENLIEKLTRTAQDQMKGLSLLQFQNCRLNSLMIELDNELLQKQVQSNCLKRSLHDAQNLAWHKQTKLQMLKSDINQLKYRL